MHRRALRLIANGLIVVGAVVGIAGFVPLGSNGPQIARADAVRSVTLSQTSELINQVVTVAWSGFRPTLSNGNFNTIILQCSLNPTSLADCYTANPFPDPMDGTKVLGITNSAGTGAVSFEVRPAANLPSLNCSQSNPCSIMVYENDGIDPGDGLPSTATLVRLDFAASIADCPPVTDYDVRLDGSASAAQVFYRWAAGKCTGADNLVIDYTTTNDTSGRENFLADLVDVGVTGVEVSSEELESHPGHRDFIYAPVALTAVVVAYNMRDASTGTPIPTEVTHKETLREVPTLRLTQRLLATMVTDSNPTALFGDLEFRQINSQREFVASDRVNLPNNGVEYPLLRAELCADTRIITGWIAADSNAKKFLLGQDAYGRQLNAAYSGISYPRESFENIAQSSSFVPRLGQENVAKKLFYGTPPALQAPVNTKEQGLIGIIDLPTALRFGLGVFGVRNGAGEFVIPNAQTVTAGFAAMQTATSGVRTNNFSSTVSGIYPMVKIDYAMVPVSGVSKGLAGSIASLLEYAIGPGQTQLPVGYFPLPTTLKNQTRAAITSLKSLVIDASPSTTETPYESTYVAPTLEPPVVIPTTPTTLDNREIVKPIDSLPGGSPSVMFPTVFIGAAISGLGILSRNRLKGSR